MSGGIRVGNEVEGPVEVNREGCWKVAFPSFVLSTVDLGLGIEKVEPNFYHSLRYATIDNPHREPNFEVLPLLITFSNRVGTVLSPNYLMSAKMERQGVLVQYM